MSDVNWLNTVIALDPVVQNAPEFTNNGTDVSNESLTQSKATIVLTQTGIYNEPNIERFQPEYLLHLWQQFWCHGVKFMTLSLWEQLMQ